MKTFFQLLRCSSLTGELEENIGVKNWNDKFAIHQLTYGSCEVFMFQSTWDTLVGKYKTSFQKLFGSEIIHNGKVKQLMW